MEEVQGREEVYVIQTGGWVGVREDFLEELTSRLRLDNCVNVSMKGKEIFRRRDVLHRGRYVKHDVITEQSSSVSQVCIVGEGRVQDLKMKPKS